jgi:hypothetical protein
MREIIDTQSSHAGSLKRADVDKTPSDLMVLGPQRILKIFYLFDVITSLVSMEHGVYGCEM